MSNPPPFARRATVIAALVVRAVVQPSIAHAQSIGAAPPPLSDGAIIASARDPIDSANAAWRTAMKRRDVAAIVAPYADGAVFVVPSGASVTGRDAIARLMRDRFAQNGPATGATIHQDGLAVAGPYIYEWGHATVEYLRDGATMRAPGRYVTVWARDAGGRWRIIRNLSLAP